MHSHLFMYIYFFLSFFYTCVCPYRVTRNFKELQTTNNQIVVCQNSKTLAIKSNIASRNPSKKSHHISRLFSMDQNMLIQYTISWFVTDSYIMILKDPTPCTKCGQLNSERPTPYTNEVS